MLFRKRCTTFLVNIQAKLLSINGRNNIANQKRSPTKHEMYEIYYLNYKNFQFSIVSKPNPSLPKTLKVTLAAYISPESSAKDCPHYIFTIIIYLSL